MRHERRLASNINEEEHIVYVFTGPSLDEAHKLEASYSPACSPLSVRLSNLLILRTNFRAGVTLGEAVEKPRTPRRESRGDLSSDSTFVKH